MTIDIAVGTALAPLDTGPLLGSHITRWCAAQENWDRIHYDLDYARNIAGLPYTIINGALKQHLLTECLSRAFGERAWIWRLDFRFTGMDLVEEALRVDGVITELEEQAGVVRVGVELKIHNLRQDVATTAGTAVLLVRRDGAPVLDALSLPDSLSTEGQVADAADLPATVRDRLGQELSSVSSYSPVELGRLRLFAEAIMNVSPIHFDEEAGKASVHGGVVALPLFPIHAMSQKPGTLELSREREAIGREGVCEVGRNLAQLLGLPPQGLLNGGCRVHVHSLVRPGEYVQARSRLVGARRRAGRRGGDMLIYDTENTYSTTSGRPLMTEVQSMVQRMN